MLARQEASVLVAFDAEAHGDTAARWWLERLPNAQRLRPWWSDVNQMLQDGTDLRDWLASGLDAEHDHQAQREPEVATVCYLCGKEVEYYSEQGIAFCSRHWFDRLVEQGTYERMDI